MNWFRRHIRTGSQLALLALAFQFIFAFGHVHPVQAQATQKASPSQASPFQVSLSPAALYSGSQSFGELISAVIEVENGGVLTSLPASDDHDHRTHRPLTDICGICAVVAMSATALFSSSPILHLPEAVTLLYRVADAGLKHLDPGHGPFQPRGPPTS